MKTFADLKEALMREDEITVLELLDISSEDLVQRFEDVIEKRQAYIRKNIDPEYNPFDNDDYPEEEPDDYLEEDDEWN